MSKTTTLPGRRQLGKKALLPAKLVPGECYWGVVKTKLLVKGACLGVFVIFGNSELTCDTQGLLRHGWKGLQVGQQVDVEVARKRIAAKGKYQVELRLV